LSPCKHLTKIIVANTIVLRGESTDR